MTKRKSRPEYDNDPEDYGAGGRYAADDDAYNAYDADDTAPYDAVDGSDYYYADADEYEDAPYGERYEIAPDDADFDNGDPAYEMYEQVYRRVSTRAEKTLERPKRRRRKPPEPRPPGKLRVFLGRHKKPLIRLAAAALILTLFVYLWQRPESENTFSAQAPSVAPPVVRCGDASGEWPQDVPLTGHTIPALIKNNLSWPGERHGYQFHGNAGDTWRITAEARGSSTLDPLIRLFDRSGREIGSADDRTAQDYTAELTIVLPSSGAYCVLVESAQGGMTTGPYWLSAWEIN